MSLCIPVKGLERLPVPEAFDDLNAYETVGGGRTMSSIRQSDPAKPSSKQSKLYNKPVLKVYGNIETITATVGNTNNMDGGTGSMQKTS